MFKEKPVFAKLGDGSLPFSKSVRLRNIIYLCGLADGFKKPFFVSYVFPPVSYD